MAQQIAVRSQVESYQRPSSLTFSTVRYVTRVKWSNLGNEVASSPTPRCCSNQKVSFCLQMWLYILDYLLSILIVNIKLSTHIHAYIYIYIYIFNGPFNYEHHTSHTNFTHTHIHIYIYIYVCVCVCVCVCVRTRAYVCDLLRSLLIMNITIYTHTNIHTYIW